MPFFSLDPNASKWKRGDCGSGRGSNILYRNLMNELKQGLGCEAAQDFSANLVER
jgi:hypothetical protein